MRLTTFASIVVLGVAGAAIAQVSQPPRHGGGRHGMATNTMMMNNSMMNDMGPDMPMTGSNSMSNGTDGGDAPGNTVGAPTEIK